MDGIILILVVIFSCCLILGIIDPILVIKWGPEEKKTRKNVFMYFGVGLVIVSSWLSLTNYNNEKKAAIIKIQNEAEVKKKQAKENEKYTTLLDSGKTYEAMTTQERTDINELLQTWNEKNQEFKDKYQSKKELVEKSKDEAMAKWKAEKEAQDAKKAEEDKIGYDTGITYDQLARTPDDYKGKKAKFNGKVVQALEGTGETDLRIAVNGNYDTILYVAYDSKISSVRILENDNVTVKGVSQGIYAYTSTSGRKISIPLLKVDEITLNK
ncbi:cell envelope integrity protein TolA [Clostridium saccharobutylicum]|uniref:cell envelope integrity protein TolA n=1 Tax=Clostridium saccharobutylicum TaxID=169679 RepID=UPI0004076B06|nr:cell envelope integrity protein TolA [Clostridium saccharobutylicum]AQR91232.1 hypothetical protein CLOSC_29560 [Clostridium saccharobutylicum]AQS01136.1 hypothetical protein CSACC_29630 [Clostridium saccharobutylicum]AQS15119.1 hypothetical protein CLOSACC_29630 [Clostridium saccharobutylicum]MBA2905245.1 hypothetical protein [Clostridium saccharobutylicum]MBA8789818.1 hypothetical protein [Clostridium saccharobutylicum]